MDKNINSGVRKTLRNETTKWYIEIMSFHVYILQCFDKTYYVGCTNNLEKRLIEHNTSGKGAHYTKLRRPVTLKHSEVFETLLQARRREKEIKGWRRKKKEGLFLK